MSPDLVDKLSGARDFASLSRSILSLCEPFGAVHSFKLVHNRGVSRVACIIELESQKQHAALARRLGARTVNGAACLEIPVPRDFGAPVETPVLVRVASPGAATQHLHS